MATCAMRTLAFGVLFVSGFSFRLRGAPATVPMVDVTEVVQRKSFTTSGYRCCCSKHKGWRDDLRFWVSYAGYCQISETQRCGGYLGLFGGVSVAPQTYIAHNYEDTDGKCDIPSSTSFSFEDFYAAHGSPSNYCSADIVFRTPSGEVLVASASSASLGEEVAYSCPDGWEVPLGKGKVMCEFESPHAGTFTDVSCQKIQEGSGSTPKPTDYEDEEQHQDQVGDENLLPDEDKDDKNHSGEIEDDEGQHQHEDAEPNQDQVGDEGKGEDEDSKHQHNEDEDESHHLGDSEDDDDDEEQHQEQNDDVHQDKAGDEDNAEDKQHQRDEDENHTHQPGQGEGDENSHQEQHENETSVTRTTTSTPTDAETIKKVTDGITEEAKAICKRGHQGEFCCVRQCKKLSEENAKSLAVYVKATCVQECSKAWRGANKRLARSLAKQIDSQLPYL